MQYSGIHITVLGVSVRGVGRAGVKRRAWGVRGGGRCTCAPARGGASARLDPPIPRTQTQVHTWQGCGAGPGTPRARTPPQCRRPPPAAAAWTARGGRARGGRRAWACARGEGWDAPPARPRAPWPPPPPAHTPPFKKQTTKTHAHLLDHGSEVRQAGQVLPADGAGGGRPRRRQQPRGPQFLGHSLLRAWMLGYQILHGGEWGGGGWA